MTAINVLAGLKRSVCGPSCVAFVLALLGRGMNFTIIFRKLVWTVGLADNRFEGRFRARDRSHLVQEVAQPAMVCGLTDKILMSIGIDNDARLPRQVAANNGASDARLV